jgi:ornithine--oxo-acid transaminase
MPFEGEGDALFATDAACLWAGHRIPTLHASRLYLRDIWNVDVISLRLIDSRFPHLDSCFCPLFGGHLIYFPGAFDAASQSRIEAHYSEDKRIVVSEADALRFACNAINIGRTIIVHEISSELRQRLESLGFRVVAVHLGEFLKAGGAAKRLALRLSEVDLTHVADAAFVPTHASSNDDDLRPAYIVG